MLKIENPTVEEAVAAVLVASCIEASIQQATEMTGGKLDLLFALILADSSPKMVNGPLTIRCAEKAAELLADLLAIGRSADELLRSGEGLASASPIANPKSEIRNPQ